jgi:hypothetical protein
VIGEKGGVTGGPEKKSGNERVAEKTGTAEEDGDDGKEGQGVEDVADPETVGDGTGDDGDQVRWGDAGVGVGAEEVVVVREEVGTDDEDVIAEPDDSSDDGGRNAEAEEGAQAVSGAGPEKPGDGGEEKDGGGLGEDHEGNEKTEGEERQGLLKTGSKRSWGSSLPMWGGERCGEEGEQGKEDEERLEDRHAGEDVTEGVYCQEQDGDSGSEGGFGFFPGGEKLPAAEQQVGDEEDETEDGYGETAGGDEVDSGEAKESCFEKRPDGKGCSGIEVSGDVPVTELEVADGAVAVPALVGVFGPIHPGGVVGEVSVEMGGVQGQEDCCDKKENGFCELENSGRNGARLVH